jgi:hypothetical protein
MWKEMESIGRTIRWISTMMSRGEGGYFGGCVLIIPSQAFLEPLRESAGIDITGNDSVMLSWVSHKFTYLQSTYSARHADISSDHGSVFPIIPTLTVSSTYIVGC